ncbi:hypothetical protein KEM56_005190, partial [Ascosphaera pollenicola]
DLASPPDAKDPSLVQQQQGQQSQQQQQQQQQQPAQGQGQQGQQPAALETPAATPTNTNSAGVSGIVPTLQNIVATVNLDCRLDLKTIALHARNAEYNPKLLNRV